MNESLTLFPPVIVKCFVAYARAVNVLLTIFIASNLGSRNMSLQSENFLMPVKSFVEFLCLQLKFGEQ